MEQKIYSVSRVNSYIRGMFEDDALLGHIWVEGEVSNLSYHSGTGHIYFSIKDEKSQLSCVMFKGKRNGLKFRMEEGQKINVHGCISVFERDGKYQLYADNIRLSGQGELYERFLQLKNDLEDEGLFSPIYKKKLPVLIKRLGIVTAKDGAALQDIINISKRRNPYIQLILYPAQVQGEGAAESIVKGIKRFEKENVDAVIIGRGGGSIEDLWAFNEEIVARAVFDSPVPVISAVGHATDTSISDFAADVYAPTPSAAAELAVINIRDVCDNISEYEEKLNHRIRKKLEFNRNILSNYRLRLIKKSPESRIEMGKKDLESISEKMTASMRYCILKYQQDLVSMEEKLEIKFKDKLQKRRFELGIYIEKLKALSPLEKLSKGYSYVSTKEGKAVSSVNQIKPKDEIKMQFADGTAFGIIEKIIKEKRPDYGRKD